jgi:peroxiredoxin
MVLTQSRMLALKTKAPDFKLTDAVSGKQLSLLQLKARATVIMFICNHCPFVKHIQAGLVGLTNDYLSKDISFVAISSNDIQAHPEDSPARMKELAQSWGYNFPYLYDLTQEVAKAYQAACTPDFYIFDKNLELVYRGQMDDSRPSNNLPVTGHDLRQALDSILADEPIDQEQKPSIGCNIKWKNY